MTEKVVNGKNEKKMVDFFFFHSEKDFRAEEKIGHGQQKWRRRQNSKQHLTEHQQSRLFSALQQCLPNQAKPSAK